MQDTSLLLTMKAVYLLQIGQDITKDFSTPADRDSINTVYKLDKPLKDFIKVYSADYLYFLKGKFGALTEEGFIEDKAQFKDVEVRELSYDNFYKVMVLVKEKRLHNYDDISPEFFDPDFMVKLEEEHRAHSYTAANTTALATKRFDTEFYATVALSQYPPVVTKALVDAYDKPAEFAFNGAAEFTPTNNRIMIPLSPKDKYMIKKELGDKLDKTDTAFNYLVISKNPLDYYWCGYGNDFQSCYALTSSHRGVHGYIPFSTIKESFCVYFSNGDMKKTALISGSKFSHPHMLMRSWGALTADGKIVLDFWYHKSTSTRQKTEELLTDFLLETFPDMFVSGKRTKRVDLHDDGKAFTKCWDKHNTYFYSDSLGRTRDTVSFCYKSVDNWSNAVRPSWVVNDCSFEYHTRKVTGLSKTFDISKPYKVIQGMLSNYKVCAKTGFELTEGDKQHYTAKYFRQECKNPLLISYNNGFLSIEAGVEKCDHPALHIGKCCCDDLDTNKVWINPDSKSHRFNLKDLKTVLKNNINRMGDIDVVVLKQINKNNIEYNLYYNKEQ